MLIGDRAPESSSSSASRIALAVSSLSSPFKMRSSLVLYESQLLHLLPSQWYLTDDFAAQSLHWMMARVLTNCSGIG